MLAAVREVTLTSRRSNKSGEWAKSSVFYNSRMSRIEWRTRDADPAVTCVQTETTNPEHMAENIQAALGCLPNQSDQARDAGADQGVMTGPSGEAN
jgi:hypothetical protein